MVIFQLFVYNFYLETATLQKKLALLWAFENNHLDFAHFVVAELIRQAH